MTSPSSLVPGLHPVVSSALQARRYAPLTSVQFQTLSRVLNHQLAMGMGLMKKPSDISNIINSSHQQQQGTTITSSTASNADDDYYHSGTDPSICPDCIVETPRNCGHCLCMVTYTAHFILSACAPLSLLPGAANSNNKQHPSPFAIIIARDLSQVSHIIRVAADLSVQGVKFVDAGALDQLANINAGGTTTAGGASDFFTSASAPPAPASFAAIAAGLKAGNNNNAAAAKPTLARSVIVGTTATLTHLDWAAAHSHNATCVTLIVEEASPPSNNASLTTPPPNSTARHLRYTSSNNQNEALISKIASFIGRVNQYWPNVNLCLLSSRPPSTVHPSLRYILRRNNRAYLPAHSAVPTFSTLLCHNANDRAELCNRLTMTEGLNKLLILTHNKEVKELKTELHKQLGLRTFAIQRATATTERERILSDFLECHQGVLVAMDAFTGIDLMDVDGVIQYHPPQKSMSDEAWAEFVSFLRSTGDSDPRNSGASSHNNSRCTVISFTAVDELNLIKHFQSKVGFTGPVLNMSPRHRNFRDFVLEPNLAVLARVHRDEQENVFGNDLAGLSLPYAIFKRAYQVERVGVVQPKSSSAYNNNNNNSNNTLSMPAPAHHHHHGGSGNTPVSSGGGDASSLPAPKSQKLSGQLEETGDDDDYQQSSSYGNKNRGGNNKNYNNNNKNNRNKQ